MGEKQKFSDANILKMLVSVPLIGLGGAMLGLLAKFYNSESSGLTIEKAIGFGLIALAPVAFGLIYGFTWGTRIVEYNNRRWTLRSRFGWTIESGSFEEIRDVSLKKVVNTDLNGRRSIVYEVGLELKESETVIRLKSIRRVEKSREVAEESARSIGVDLIDDMGPGLSKSP